MDKEEIKKTLARMEQWMMMTCEGCALPEKLNPLIEELRRLLAGESTDNQNPVSGGKPSA